MVQIVKTYEGVFTDVKINEWWTCGKFLGIGPTYEVWEVVGTVFNTKTSTVCW